MSSARHVGLMLGLALLLGACGEVSSPAPDSARAPVVEWGFRQKEFVHMFLPRVARGRRGPMYLEGRALHVLPNGDVIFAGLRYPLATVDEAGYRASLAALGPRIQRQSPLNLNADPFIRWQYVRDVLGLAFEDREGAFLLRWGVTVPAAGGDLCQEADVRLLDAADAGDREHPLAIEVRAREIDGHIVETTLSIGSRAWTMSCDMLTEDPSQSGDLPWAQARAHLAVAAPMPTRAVLRTSDTKAVTWATSRSAST